MGTQLKVSDLMSSIAKGDLILPEFQRGYVWNRDQVKEYLTSLYKGYPTGSFLIWKTPNPGLTRGGIQDGGNGAFQLILDGQQRLTTLYALLTGEPPPFYEGEDLYFDIYFNVQTEEFSYFKPLQMKGLKEWLPVTPFLKAGLGDYLTAIGSREPEVRDFLFSFLGRLNQLDQIKSYTYYLDTLGEHEMDEVVKIFNLVNKQGTPLTKADLALSHICALWPEARQEMRSVQRVHADAHFNFGLNFYVRCTSSVTTGSALYEPLYKATVEEIQAGWLRTEKALDYLLNVLRSDGFIDSSVALVSENVLVPLVVYIANSNGKFTSESEKRRFLHWMYAALMWNRYSGATETKMQRDLEALKGDDPTKKLIENIIAERGRIKVEGRDLINASTRTAWATMAYVVARADGAADWFNGLALYNRLLGRSNGLESHHIFPSSLLYKSKYDSSASNDRQKVNEIANIAFLTSSSNKAVSNAPPIAYLPAVEKAYPGALAAQRVPENPALWEMDRFEDFLAARRERLAGAINQFMDRLLDDQSPSSYTVADYIAAGESETVEFKGSLRWDVKQKVPNKVLEKVVAKTIAGFMNAKGGTLVIGVSDEGEVWGIEADYATLGQRKDRDGWEQHLRNVLNNFLSKDVAALVETSFAEVEGKTVAVLRADSLFKPVFLTEGNATEFYVRAGNTTQQLDVKQTMEYVKQRFPAIA